LGLFKLHKTGKSITHLNELYTRRGDKGIDI
jgi:hypothetical protein